MKTQHKPYVRAMMPSWRQKMGFYRFHMLREGTSVLAGYGLASRCCMACLH